MKYMLKQTTERVWTVREKDNESELSESQFRIIESGFPDKWLVIKEDAYGKLTISRANRAKLERMFGIVPV